MIGEHDVKAGWCKCGEYHKSERKIEPFAGRERPGTLPPALPCGCVLKNAQGAAISGRYAPTKRLADGSRKCRHGKLWKLETRFVEVKK